ncbi:MAG: hypothetical protein ABEJ27_08070 [Halodesulfurarchaeum sp.]
MKENERARSQAGGFKRGVAIIAAGLIGMGLGALHWLGILLGGVGIGLIASTTRRGLLLGLAYGIAVWGVSMGTLLLGAGAWNPRATQLYGLSLGIAVLFGLVGASARALRPLASTLVRGKPS